MSGPALAELLEIDGLPEGLKDSIRRRLNG
jgi:hypothetical protein